MPASPGSLARPPLRATVSTAAAPSSAAASPYVRRPRTADPSRGPRHEPRFTGRRRRRNGNGANCGFRLRHPLDRPIASTDRFAMHRARSATRSKPVTQALRASGRSTWQVDESATGSVNLFCPQGRNPPSGFLPRDPRLRRGTALKASASRAATAPSRRCGRSSERFPPMRTGWRLPVAQPNAAAL